MASRNDRDGVFGRRSVDPAQKIHQIARDIPKTGTFRLDRQLRRAGNVTASHNAEKQGRGVPPDIKRLLGTV